GGPRGPTGPRGKPGGQPREEAQVRAIPLHRPALVETPAAASAKRYPKSRAVLRERFDGRPTHDAQEGRRILREVVGGGGHPLALGERIVRNLGAGPAGCRSHGPRHPPPGEAPPPTRPPH